MFILIRGLSGAGGVMAAPITEADIITVIIIGIDQ
jgi:hypothetical protein